MAEGQPIDQPVSVIYFREQSGAMAKALGVRIRDQGAMTRLVWAHLFRGPDQLIENARAVVVEDAAPNAAKIVFAYEQFAHEVEIHYVDSDGKFVEEPDHIGDKRRANAGTGQGGFVDPKAAIASLAAAQPDPEPVADDEPSADVDRATDPVSDESLLDEVDEVPADGDNGGGEATEPDSGLHSEEVPEDDDSS